MSFSSKMPVKDGNMQDFLSPFKGSKRKNRCVPSLLGNRILNEGLFLRNQEEKKIQKEKPK
jgi:hypothetical protein